MNNQTAHEPVSNGILLAMSPENRAARIDGLPPAVRLKLARIACLGASHEAGKVDHRIEEKTYRWASQSAAHARDLSGLAADLLKGMDA